MAERVASGPSWAWWGRPEPELPLRHAVRILERAAGLEELVEAAGAPGAAPGVGAPLDRALRAYQAQHRELGRLDRLVLGTAVYGLARNRELLRSAWPDARPGDGRRLLLALLDARGGPPGDVPHLPGGPRPWTAALGRLASLRHELVAAVEGARDAALPDGAPDAALAAATTLFGVPRWWFAAGPWRRLADAAAELGRLRRPQALVLRAQAHRGPREAAQAELTRLGVPSRPTARSPWGLRVEGRHNVLATAPYRDGRVEVQDEGSQLVACLCDPKPGERVLDLCAGGGGKTLALAAAMGGRGAVVAHDVDLRRLADTRERARRAGLGNVRVLADPGAVAAAGPYDTVLVDAPCTSTGTLRRNPDVAWRWQPADLERLTALQAEILDRAAALVRPGGALVYATCSLLAAENHCQFEAFLARHGDFAAAPPGDRKAHAPLLDVPGAASGALRLPADLERYDGDGFFLARARRQP
jgi:16S rRNA (cytosine967-C5)-methyltransferase